MRNLKGTPLLLIGFLVASVGSVMVPLLFALLSGTTTAPSEATQSGLLGGMFLVSLLGVGIFTLGSTQVANEWYREDPEGMHRFLSQPLFPSFL